MSAFHKKIFVVGFFIFASSAVANAACTSCFTTVNTHQQCGGYPITITTLPFNVGCGDGAETHHHLTFSPGTACSYSSSNKIQLTVSSCVYDFSVSCDPCCGSCPVAQPMVTTHSD